MWTFLFLKSAVCTLFLQNPVATLEQFIGGMSLAVDRQFKEREDLTKDTW